MKGILSVKNLIASVFAASLLALSASALSETGVKQTEPTHQVETTKATSSQTAPVSGSININKADVQTLAQLNGVGEKKAQAIIAYREAKGGFKSVDELLNVKGIGQKTLEKNRSLLSAN